MVHQGLQLHGPVLKILDFVEEQVNGLVSISERVERVPQDVLLEPTDERDDRLREGPQRRRVVKFQAEDSRRRNMIEFQKLFDQLLLDRRLSNLSRTAHGHNGCKVQGQPSSDFRECPSAK